LSSVGPLPSRRGSRGHAGDTVPDREAPGSNPGPPTNVVFKIGDFGGCLFDACARAPRDGPGPDSAVRRRRDAAFLALAYGCGLRRSEAVAVDLADLDLVSGELRVRRGKGRKPQQLNLPPSAVPALQDWLQVRGQEPGPLFCAVLKSGRLARGGEGLARLSPAAAWRICRERGLKAQIQARPRTTCAEPGSGTCSIWTSTWPRCRRWRGMPPPRPPPATTEGIGACSAGPRSCSMCLTQFRRTEPPRQRGSAQPAGRPSYSVGAQAHRGGPGKSMRARDEPRIHWAALLEISRPVRARQLTLGGSK
jgi:integrase-like protein